MPILGETFNVPFLTVTTDVNPTPTAPQPASVSHGDPEEVDISEHFYQPPPNIRAQNATPNPNRPYPGLSSDPTQIDDQALRAMMLGFPPPNGSSQPQPNPFGGPNPFAAMGNPDGTGDAAANDPMMAMLQQMMGGAGGEPGAMPSFPGLPPMGFPGNDPSGAPAVNKSAYIWRIVHAIFALGFGLYIAFTTEFGTKTARHASIDSGVDLRAFYVFATVEAILQGTRFIFDRGQDSQSGIMGMILRFLPQPFGGYLRMFMNYRSIWTTTSADAMVVVFVLVAVNYWRIPSEYGGNVELSNIHEIEL